MTRTRRYITNVLWSWVGVAIALAAAVLLAPYVIRHIGDVKYGLWTLGLSLVEYYWLIEFGFRSATIKYSAQYLVSGDKEKRDLLLSTGLFFTSVVALIVLAAAVIFAPQVSRIFHIADPDFILLMRIVGASWSLGVVSNIFSAFLEGMQRFDLTTRVWISITLLRSGGTVLLLAMGGGLRAMGGMLLAAQVFGCGMSYVLFRRTAPDARVSMFRPSLAMAREMLRYGVHTFTAIVSNILIGRSVPVLIAYYLPIENLAYFSIPVRILTYATEGVGRIGMVTAPNATELLISGRSEALADLAVFANRYCFMVFAPVAVFLLHYGFPLYSLWIRPDFALKSAYLLPVLLIGEVVVAGQANSVSVLFGMGRHQAYSRCLMGEALLTLALIPLVLPRFGLLGAAWVTTVLMAVDRGAVLCWLVSGELGINPWTYARRIYALPAFFGAIVWALVGALKRTILPGQTWSQLILAGSAGVLAYWLMAFRFCVAPQHREQALAKIRSLLPRMR